MPVRGRRSGSAILAGAGLAALFVAALPAEGGVAKKAPQRVYSTWLEGRPGYFPPSDPESMSVVTGVRQSKLVDLPFTGGRASLAGVARAVVQGLAAGRADSLGKLCITRREFEEILWLDFPSSRPVTGLTADDAWGPLAVRLTSGIAGALSEFGNAELEYVGVEETLGVKEFRNFRLHRGIVITVRDEAGETRALRFVRTIAERKGRFKIYSTDD
jgi:hypothetical protein